LLATAGAVWLGYEGWRLLFQGGYWGAIDLGNYHRLVGDWFAGRPVYADHTSIHPPATYLIMWPFVGWLPFEAARWLWAATTAIVLALLIRIGIRASGAEGRAERLLIGLLPLGTYPVGATIGNGQVGIHLLVALFSLFALLEKRPRRLRDHLGLALLLCLCLMKPTLSVPFFLLVLVRPGGFGPASLAAFGYLGATAAAAAVRSEGLFELIRAWITSDGLDQKGTANLQAWLHANGLASAGLPATLLVLLLLTAWLARHRLGRLDVQLGVVAIVARLFTYHRWYDDVLLLVPLLVLFRIAREGGSGSRDVVAGLLFGAGLLGMLAPGGLYLFPEPWNRIYLGALVTVWLAMLAFLAAAAERELALEKARSLVARDAP
jgi:hypothetical protein